MGRNKLLVEIDGEPLVRTIVRRAIEADLDPVVVVTGHDRERVIAALEELPCHHEHNSAHAGGMTTSLRAGVAALPSDVDAALMILGDMPLVTSVMMGILIKTFRSSEVEIVLSRYGEVNAPPTLFCREVFPELLDLPNDQSPRSVVERHTQSTSIVNWPESCLKDLDRPEDLEELVAGRAD